MRTSVTLLASLQRQGRALTSPPWCPLQVVRSVSVHGHGYMTLALKDVPGLRDFYSGFGFQTSQREGLLYHHTTQVGTCSPPERPSSRAETSAPALGRVLFALGKGGDFGGARGMKICTLSSQRVVRRWALPWGSAAQQQWGDAFCRRGRAGCPSRGAS